MKISTFLRFATFITLICSFSACSFSQQPKGQIAYIFKDASGTHQIYTINVDGSGIKRLTNLGPNYSPAWSPDGKKIAFISSRNGGGEIFVMDKDGSNQINLTPATISIGEPVWSPDGSKILFLANPGSTDLHQTEFGLYTMNSDGTYWQQLAYGSFDGYSWSPDGRKIVFALYQDKSKQWDLYVIDSGGGNLSNITNSSDWEGNPKWSPDGKKIIYTLSFDTEGTYESINVTFSHQQLFVMDIDESNQNRLSNDTSKSQNSTYIGRYSWSPDGKKVVYVEDNNIYIINADGSNRKEIIGTGDTRSNSLPTWSPDGQWISFLSNEKYYINPDFKTDVFIVDIDGNNLTNLTNSPTGVGVPVWSP